jgi:hypothetical protein
MAKQLQCLYRCNIVLVRTVVRQLAIGSVEDRSRERHTIICEITPRCEISGFFRDVVDVFDLPEFSRRRLPVGYRSYGINLSVPFSHPWLSTMELICCPETSVTNHQTRQLSIPESRRHQLVSYLIMCTQNITFWQKNANQRQILVTRTFGGPLEWGAARSAGVLTTPLVIKHNHNVAKKRLKLTKAESIRKCVRLLF